MSTTAVRHTRPAVAAAFGLGVGLVVAIVILAFLWPVATSEPHDLPVQFLSEAGIVGFLLFAGSVVLLLRGSLRRRGPDLALALIFPAYLLHGLVDIDWDFVAVSAPALLVAGSLVGGPPRRSAGGRAPLR